MRINEIGNVERYRQSDSVTTKEPYQKIKLPRVKPYPTPFPATDEPQTEYQIVESETKSDTATTSANTKSAPNQEELNKQKGIFNTSDDLLKAIDRDGDGVCSKSEIIAAQQYFKSAGITEVTVGGVKFNLITDANKNKRGVVKGTKGNDLILCTDAKKVKGKGGDDIIIGADIKKVKGGKGSDTIFYSGEGSKIKGGKGTDYLFIKGDNKIRNKKGTDQVTLIPDETEQDDGLKKL